MRADKPGVDAYLTKAANEIKTILSKSHPRYWREIIERTGCVEALEAMPAGATLDDLNEDDIEALKKIHVASMKQAMQNGNAQAMAVFQRWVSEKEGEKQLEGLQISVVPATVPDNMSEELLFKMTELTEIASRS